MLLSRIKHLPRLEDGLLKCCRVLRATPDVEGHPHEVEAELRRISEELGDILHLNTILVPKLTTRRGIIGADPQQQRGIRSHCRRLLELASAVDHADRNTAVQRIPHFPRELAAVGINHALRRDTKAEDEVKLCPRGAVKPCAKRRERRDECRVAVALHCIVRVHARQRLAPGSIEAPNDAEVVQVEHVERLRIRRRDHCSSLLAHVGPDAAAGARDNAVGREYRSEVVVPTGIPHEDTDEVRVLARRGRARLSIRRGGHMLERPRHGVAGHGRGKAEGPVHAAPRGSPCAGLPRGAPHFLARSPDARDVRELAADVQGNAAAVRRLRKQRREFQLSVPDLVADSGVCRHAHCKGAGLKDVGDPRHKLGWAVGPDGEAAKLDARVAACLLGGDVDGEEAGALKPIQRVSAGVEEDGIHVSKRRQSPNAAGSCQLFDTPEVRPTMEACSLGSVEARHADLKGLGGTMRGDICASSVHMPLQSTERIPQDLSSAPRKANVPKMPLEEGSLVREELVILRLFVWEKVASP
mmetsp:Transcript_2724/g.6364  ORF Transcript_2724/g.6364 Transcript_2724/m.6364 type:complete len:527 (-) Transcript_2724:1018-2598(-)